MKKMRGVIDPWTLGFIISFFGGITGYIVHPPGEQNNIEANIQQNQINREKIIAINEINTVTSDQ